VKPVISPSILKPVCHNVKTLMKVLISFWLFIAREIKKEEEKKDLIFSKNKMTVLRGTTTNTII
jgi:hypothetical protein